MSKKFPNRLALMTVLLLAVSCMFAASFGTVNAAACPVPSTDLGTDSLTINVPATATYTIWTRMKAPDASHNSINLEVDGANCFNVGGGSFTATSWQAGSGNWIKYQGGSTSNIASLSLNAGNHTFKYVGTQAGVEVDRIILSSDASCTPTGTGGNCQSGDSTPPTASLLGVTSGQVVTGTINLQSTASDASGIASVEFLIDGTVVGSDTTSPYEYSWNSAGVPNGSHTVAAKATDAKNNATTTTPVTVTVSNSVPCTGSPSIPANLQSPAKTSSSVGLSWNASTPAAGCTMQGYVIYRNGTQVGTSTATSYTDNSLTPATAYSYSVAAVDTTGHTSAKSGAISVTTAADTVAPTVPANLIVTLKTATSVSFSWTASTDSSGIKDYIVYRNGTQVGTSTTTNFTDGALAPSTAYSFTVKARDYANNTSAASSALSVTTLAGSGANLGDLNNSGKVDLTDLSILLSHWGQTGVPVTQGDINASGKVDLTDLSILLSNWGKSV